MRIYKIMNRKVRVTVFTLLFLILIFISLYFLPKPVPQPVTSIIPVTKPTIVKKYELKTHKLYVRGIRESNPKLCFNLGQTTKILIIATSAPENTETRMAVRNTWFQFRSKYQGITAAFLVGLTTNQTTQAKLERENDIYGDIIQGKFIDSYDNLTLKSISVLEWAKHNCPYADFTLKADDDGFINIPNLMEAIGKLNKQDRKIYGTVAKDWIPIRNESSKYYLTHSQYSNGKLPFFTLGLAYLIPTQFAHDIFTVSVGTDRPYLKLEDVYITGISADKLKIPRSNIPYFVNKKYPDDFTYSLCELRRGVSFHLKQNHTKQYEFWGMLFKDEYYSTSKSCKK